MQEKILNQELLLIKFQGNNLQIFSKLDNK